jgi:hypothetical protein
MVRLIRIFCFLEVHNTLNKATYLPYKAAVKNHADIASENMLRKMEL